VNGAWHRFAEQNGGAGVAAISSYFDGIGGPFRDYYARAFAEALATSKPFEQDYECSSPAELRRFHLRALPIDGRALVLEHSLTVALPHEPATAALPIEWYLAPTGFIHQCSNCRRVRRPETTEWDWVPALVERVHPATSHGICPPCLGFYWSRYWGPGR
jgi:hypothetical protein